MRPELRNGLLVVLTISLFAAACLVFRVGQ
jgi:hypothetical protein